jgi:hypothetical protein
MGLNRLDILGFPLRNLWEQSQDIGKSLFKMDSARSTIDLVTAAAVNGTLSEELRVALLEATNKLVAVLEKPEDAITKLAYQVKILSPHAAEMHE